MTMREQLIMYMQGLFGDDLRRIDHALAVLGHAEAILAAEPTADTEIVTAAAILHDIGIHEAERKHGSSAGRWQEIECPPIARAILARTAMAPDKIEHVCSIVAHHHSAGFDSVEFRILWDADWLVNIPDEFPNETGPTMKARITKLFRTRAGLSRARDIYLKKG